MKPDWDKLIAAYKDHASTLIADVDCTTGGKSLCEEVGVRGYPTIKYGDPNDLQDYKGGRDFAALKKFAEGLGPQCGPANLELCDEAKKKQINELMAMTAADLEAKIEEKEKEQKDAEELFTAEVEKLQKKYEELEKEKKETIQAVKDSGLGLMKAVKIAKKGKEEL